MRGIAEQLLAVDEEWRSSHRDFRSIRAKVLIPAIYRKRDLIEVSNNLLAVQEDLESVQPIREAAGSAKEMDRVEAYRVALSSGVRLLREVCVLEHRYVWQGDRSCARELTQKTTQYRRVRAIAISLRKELERSNLL